MSDNIKRDAALVAAKLHVVMGKSGLFDGCEIQAIISGTMFYASMMAASVGVEKTMLHELLDAICKDYSDSLENSRRWGDAVREKISEEAKARCAREQKLADTVKAADAEADRIISACFKANEPDPSGAPEAEPSQSEEREKKP